MHYFGRRHRHLVPGTATINGMGYICDLDGKRFTDRDVFVAHLRTAHHTAPARIPELLLMDDGRIHFLGEQTAATGQLTDIAPVVPLLADLEALSRESALAFSLVGAGLIVMLSLSGAVVWSSRTAAPDAAAPS